MYTEFSGLTLAEKIKLSTQKVHQMMSEDEDITPASLCKMYFQTDKDGRRFIRTFAIAVLLNGAESLSGAKMITCSSLAYVRTLLQEVPLAFLQCAPDDLDCVQEEKEPLKDEDKLRADTIAEFKNAFSKHISEYFGAV